MVSLNTIQSSYLPRRYNSADFVEQLPMVYELDEMRVIYEGPITFGANRESVKLNFLARPSSF